jgi:hypothetical protein
MNKLLTFAVLSLSLGACATADPETACVSYLEAYSACASEAYAVDDGTYDLDPSTCDTYSGLSGKAASNAADLLNCYALAYNEADCSTTDGLTAATTGLSDCAAAAQ